MPREIPDLNDPALKFDRATAMKAMAERRRETVQKDMTPEAAAELAGEELQVTVIPIAKDPDADNDDAAADIERKRLEAEAAKAPEEPPVVEPVAPKPEVKKEDEPVLDATKQAAVQTDDLLLTDDDLKQVKIKVRINGRERVLTGEELRNEAQKMVAGDDYLRIAREAAKEALREQHVETPKKEEPAAPAPTQEEINADVDAAVDAIFTGKDDEIKANLKKAFLKLATPGAAKPAVGFTGDQLRAMEQVLVTRSELRQFAKDHKEIVNDEIGRGVCDRFIEKELEAIGAKRLEDLPVDRIHEVLERAATQTVPYIPALRTPATASTGGTARTLSERLKRKETTIDELPTASTRSASHVPPAKTTTDVLNEMRKARGQVLSA